MVDVAVALAALRVDLRVTLTHALGRSHQGSFCSGSPRLLRVASEGSQAVAPATIEVGIEGGAARGGFDKSYLLVRSYLLEGEDKSYL